MEGTAPYIGWEAPEHRHTERSSDWYWVLGIIAVAACVVSIILGNTLFGVVLLLGAVVMMLVSHNEPRVIPFEITSQGVRIDDTLYPYSSLESYSIDESVPEEPQLILKSKHMFGSLIVAPVPPTFVEDIDWMMRSRLEQEDLREPLAHRLLEFFGF